MLTQSKNNDPQWIADSFQFHAKNHGANALLIYDNNSDRYTPTELEAVLKNRFPGDVMKVVDWQFPFGAVGGPHKKWDSDFSPYGVLNHARFRYLAKARSVLQGDIDELVLAEDGNRSVFSAAERSLFGFIIFGGHWICEATTREETQPRRHCDFVHVAAQPDVFNTPKWCAAPWRIWHGSQWKIHSIANSRGSQHHTPKFGIRHFRAITSWRADRAITRPIQTDDRIDQALVEAMARAGLFQEVNDAPT
ncbi:hypothetical protein F8B91_13220 [Aestuariivirga litoralis]|nr:hypothetical protein [Aestuariivirga litoralis]